MKAKGVKQPTKRKIKEQPIQPTPELTMEEINTELNHYSKLIDKSNNLEEYNFGWDGFRKFTRLKENFYK